MTNHAHDTTWTVGPYEIERITPSVYAIDDVEGESMYLICGSERALLIDTGSNDMSILPIVRDLYKGPIDLALTHAHFDHMYHCDAFSRVYLHKDEIKAWKKILGLVVQVSAVASGKKAKNYHVGDFISLTEESKISLGDRIISVIAAPGHTPGSVIFVDDHDKLLFMGDAIGSGDYAWMWMPGCLCLTEYMETLRNLQMELAPLSDYRMLGGHRKQGQPFNPDGYVLNTEIIPDMGILCGQILRGETHPIKEERNFGFLTYLYRYGKAGIVLRKNKIR
ncbi:MAG: MBL fold metallo-hydrolase [Lachnospiraceae bacterium]|nr:MBL fold metallo-hydrolase [Lachnospiraceae bacterium]